MAEAYFNSLNLNGFSAESAGLYVTYSDYANPDAVDTMKVHGVNLSAHTSRQLTKDMCDDADLIVCMTRSHSDALIKSGIEEKKIFKLKQDIADPYGRGLKAYEECFLQLKSLIKDLISYLNIFQITDFEPTDARDIEELENECFSEPWSKKSVLSSYQNGTYFILCKTDGKTVAYGGVSIVSNEAYITNIAVTKGFRNLGIGRLLTERLIKEAQKSCSFISLEVRESNIPAISLYSDLGFDIVGNRKYFYRNPTENALIMTKIF